MIYRNIVQQRYEERLEREGEVGMIVTHRGSGQTVWQFEMTHLRTLSTTKIIQSGADLPSLRMCNMLHMVQGTFAPLCIAFVIKVKQSHYRPGVSQRVPGS